LPPRGSERLCPVAGPDEHRPRLLPDLCGLLVVGNGLVGSDVVGRDHLDHLVLVGNERGAQVVGRSQVTRSALALRERLVCDVADEILEKPYWPCSGERGSP
jgi:hypothetical protein